VIVLRLVVVVVVVVSFVSSSSGSLSSCSSSSSSSSLLLWRLCIVGVRSRLKAGSGGDERVMGTMTRAGEDDGCMLVVVGTMMSLGDGWAVWLCMGREMVDTEEIGLEELIGVDRPGGVVSLRVVLPLSDSLGSGVKGVYVGNDFGQEDVARVTFGYTGRLGFVWLVREYMTELEARFVPLLDAQSHTLRIEVADEEALEADLRLDDASAGSPGPYVKNLLSEGADGDTEPTSLIKLGLCCAPLASLTEPAMQAEGFKV
jgi:hypothetical protein